MQHASKPAGNWSRFLENISTRVLLRILHGSNVRTAASSCVHSHVHKSPLAEEENRNDTSETTDPKITIAVQLRSVRLERNRSTSTSEHLPSLPPGATDLRSSIERPRRRGHSRRKSRGRWAPRATERCESVADGAPATSCRQTRAQASGHRLPSESTNRDREMRRFRQQQHLVKAREGDSHRP